jgi:hypothetical protein
MGKNSAAEKKFACFIKTGPLSKAKAVKSPFFNVILS